MSSRARLWLFFFADFGLVVLTTQQSIAYPRTVARNNRGPQLLQAGFSAAQTQLTVLTRERYLPFVLLPLWCCCNAGNAMIAVSYNRTLPSPISTASRL